MKYCGHCGAPMQDYADVCLNCRKPFKNEPYEEKTQNKKKNNSVLIFAVIALIVVIVIVGIYYYSEISFFNNLLNY